MMGACCRTTEIGDFLSLTCLIIVFGISCASFFLSFFLLPEGISVVGGCALGLCISVHSLSLYVGPILFS